MSLINWDNTLSVGIKEIDTQHQKLIELINELHGAMLKGRSRDVLDQVLDGLIKYTSYHFEFEENYFEKYNYPEKEEHKNLHKKLVENVLDFQKKYKAGTAFISIEIMDFLKDWISKHIIGTDKRYTSFFNQKGLF